MTIAYWCVLMSILMPYLWVGGAKFGGKGPYDNKSPREFLGGLEGWRKRANFAQLNAFEAFAPFAAAVIIAHQTGAEQSMVNGLAIGFVACRLAYGLLYIFDLDLLRSLVWTGAMGCVVGLFVVSA